MTNFKNFCAPALIHKALAALISIANLQERASHKPPRTMAARFAALAAPAALPAMVIEP